jgi:hypothetical protein
LNSLLKYFNVVTVEEMYELIYYWVFTGKLIIFPTTARGGISLTLSDFVIASSSPWRQADQPVTVTEFSPISSADIGKHGLDALFLGRVKLKF